MKNSFLAAAVVAAVCVPAVHAATAAGATTSSDNRMTTTLAHGASAGSQAVQAPGGGLVPIMSNIGYSYPKGRYISSQGWTISGPSSLIGEQIWLGVPFTPKHGGTVYEVDVGVGYVTGTPGFVLSIYTDAGGVPGTELASFSVSKMFNFGSCCALQRTFNKTGLPVMGGQPYWVTVTTDAATADEWAAWTLNDTNQVDVMNAAVNTGTGWQPAQLIPGPSVAVFGN